MKKILAAILLLSSLTAHTAFSQTEKLGVVRYTPVGGWAKTSKPNIVAFSESDPATGKFCIISLFGAAFPTSADKQKQAMMSTAVGYGVKGEAESLHA